MSGTESRARQPKGVPSGGEFAKNEHGEALGELVETVSPPRCERHGGEWGDDPTCETCTTESGDPRPFDADAPIDYGPGSHAEENELLAAYRERVYEHGGDVIADAEDMMLAIENGEYPLHDGATQREALASLTYISEMLTPDEAREAFIDPQSLARFAVGERDPRFHSTDDQIAYESVEWSGKRNSPGGAFGVFHDRGRHAVIREDSSGRISFEEFDDHEGADERMSDLEDMHERMAGDR